jgi:CelD/BcsL family acetyltransferase involved in cellulose biosynthesis
MNLMRSKSLSYTITRNEASFEALQSEWEDLFRRAAIQTPFLRYFWLRRCWDLQRHVEEITPFIIVIREQARPVLIAPFIKRGTSLSFMDSLTPQYNDVLVEDCVNTSAYVDFFFDTLGRLRSVRRLVSTWVRDDSALAQRLATASQSSQERTYKAPFIDFEKFAHWDAYFQSLSPKLRQGHRRRLRNLQKRGAVELRMATNSTCSSDMAWLFAQKRQWLEREGKSAKWLAAPGMEEFFTEAAKEGIDSGRTWLTVLLVEGTIIAATLAFQQGTTLYGSKDAYDPAWHVYSPGRMLKLLTFERAFQNGIRKIDLMIGGYAWKEELATGVIKVRNRKVRLHGPERGARRGLLTRLLHSQLVELQKRVVIVAK